MATGYTKEFSGIFAKLKAHLWAIKMQREPKYPMKEIVKEKGKIYASVWN